MLASLHSTAPCIRFLQQSIALVFLLCCFSATSLADYQRLAIAQRDRPISVSAKGVEVEAYCLDHDLEPPPLAANDFARLSQSYRLSGLPLPPDIKAAPPVQYPALITPDTACVFVGGRKTPITIKAAMERFGLKVEGVSRLQSGLDSTGGFNLRFQSSVPLRIDVRNGPIAFSHTKGSDDDPNVIESELLDFLRTPTPQTSHRYYQQEIWSRSRILEFLRDADYWVGAKDYVTPKRMLSSQVRAKEDLKVSGDESLLHVLRTVALSKQAENRLERIAELKRRVREGNLSLPDIQAARSSRFSPMEYLRNPTNSPSIVAYEKKETSEVFVTIDPASAQPTQPKNLNVTVFHNGRRLGSQFGIDYVQNAEVRELRETTMDQVGIFGVYGTRTIDGGAILYIGKRVVMLNKEELNGFRDGSVPEKLKTVMRGLKGANNERPTVFIARSMLYQGRLGDLSKNGIPAELLDKWFVNPNELMTSFSNAFDHEIDFWLTNNILEGMNNVARLPTISQGSQMGFFKGGVLDPRGDIASVESELKTKYKVQFITKGTNKPNDTDMVIFVAHNDGPHGEFLPILHDAIRRGLLENRIVVLGICGTGNEADLASGILREGNARAVIYFDKKISSEVLTEVLTTFVKVAVGKVLNESNLQLVWRTVIQRVSQRPNISAEDLKQISIMASPRFLAFRFGKTRDERLHTNDQRHWEVK